MSAPLDEWVPDDQNDAFAEDSFGDLDGPSTAETPHPINWNLLTADEVEVEWVELNRWVNWLRRTYGLPASVVPPFWHRHPGLVWELSALHLHWLCAYHPDQHGSIHATNCLARRTSRRCRRRHHHR